MDFYKKKQEKWQKKPIFGRKGGYGLKRAKNPEKAPKRAKNGGGTKYMVNRWKLFRGEFF